MPTLGATSYQPTDAEWTDVLNGGAPGVSYKWMVIGQRQDDPAVPEGFFWYSNILSLVPRTLRGQIDWQPQGTDVDFHLANPSGTDIAYYNRTTAWGFLDRDCISDCHVENISVTSLPLAGTYRLFAHYYSDHGHGPATVHAQIFEGSTVVVDQTFTLEATGATHDILSLTVPGLPTKPREMAVTNKPGRMPAAEAERLPPKSPSGP